MTLALLVGLSLVPDCAGFEVSTAGEGGLLTVSVDGTVWFEELAGLSDISLHKVSYRAVNHSTWVSGRGM